MCENQTAKDLLDSLNRLGWLTEEEQYQKQQLEREVNRCRGQVETAYINEKANETANEAV